MVTIPEQVNAATRARVGKLSLVPFCTVLMMDHDHQVSFGWFHGSRGISRELKHPTSKLSQNQDPLRWVGVELVHCLVVYTRVSRASNCSCRTRVDALMPDSEN